MTDDFYNLDAIPWYQESEGREILKEAFGSHYQLALEILERISEPRPGTVDEVDWQSRCRIQVESLIREWQGAETPGGRTLPLLAPSRRVSSTDWEAARHDSIISFRSEDVESLFAREVEQQRMKASTATVYGRSMADWLDWCQRAGAVLKSADEARSTLESWMEHRQYAPNTRTVFRAALTHLIRMAQPDSRPLANA